MHKIFTWTVLLASLAPHVSCILKADSSINLQESIQPLETPSAPMPQIRGVIIPVQNTSLAIQTSQGEALSDPAEEAPANVQEQLPVSETLEKPTVQSSNIQTSQEEVSLDPTQEASTNVQEPLAQEELAALKRALAREPKHLGLVERELQALVKELIQQQELPESQMQATALEHLQRLLVLDLRKLPLVKFVYSMIQQQVFPKSPVQVTALVHL